MFERVQVTISFWLNVYWYLLDSGICECGADSDGVTGFCPSHRPR